MRGNLPLGKDGYCMFTEILLLITITSGVNVSIAKVLDC